MKKIILIDNGHGVDTPGKCSPDAMKGMASSRFWFKEYKWCREVAFMVCDLLQARGYDARLLVPEESDVPLATRVQRVNAVCSQYGKDNVILLSIHNNAAGDGSRWMSARGWSVWTTKGVTESDKLAEVMYNVAKMEFTAPLKVRDFSNKYLGHDFEEDFYILRNTKCPAVLVENFFQDNREDVAFLNTDEGKARCAFVIYKGLLDYSM